MNRLILSFKRDLRARQRAILALTGFVIAVAIGACATDPNVQKPAYDTVQQRAEKRAPYLPKNDVEFGIYNDAQKLYDSPTTIIWCSTTWGNASAPLVTVPVAGKLTSSTVSYFPNHRIQDDDIEGAVLTEARSVDGMFHGTPPPYRYGFTPGGQYVDFFNMPTFCTTALTKFQRERTEVALTVDAAAKAADAKAQQALKRGDKAGAQRILEQAVGQ